MKIFPTKELHFKLLDSSKITMERFNRRTLNSNYLVSTYTDKSFIGTIINNQFSVISSTIGIGALCVLSGEIFEELGILKVKINTLFKVLFILFLSFPFIALLYLLISNNFQINYF